MMTTELQGGWFVGIPDVPPLKPDADKYRSDLGPAQINNLTLYTYQHGETITNYYMLFGGTNLGDGAAQNIATCYDYSSPIRENGGVGEKYLRVKALGEFVTLHGACLARAETIAADVATDQSDVTVAVRQATDGGRYLFVRTDQHAQPRKGQAHVTIKPGQVINNRAIDATTLTFRYDLEPFGSKVLCIPAGVNDQGKWEWWPKPQPAIERPTDLAGPVTIAEVRSQADPGPQQYKPLPTGASLNHVGIYDSRFVYYRAKVSLDAAALAKGLA